MLSSTALNHLAAPEPHESGLRLGEATRSINRHLARRERTQLEFPEPDPMQARDS